MKYLFTILVIFVVRTTYSQDALLVDPDNDKIDLLDYTSCFIDSSNKISVYDLKDVEWQQKTGNNINPTANNLFNKITLENKYDRVLTKVVFIPHFYIHKLKVYQQTGENITLINKAGLKNLKNKKNSIIGYPFKIKLQPKSKTTIYIKYESYHNTFRNTTYLISEKELTDIAFYNQSVIWFWYGFYFLTILISLIVLAFFRKKQFLYYVLFILGIFLYISNHIGFLFLILNIDSANFSAAYGNTGTVIINIFLPLFLNELTPLKKHNRKLWKFLFVIVYGMIPIVFLSYFPAIRESWFSVVVFKYTMIGSAIAFLLIIYFLAKNIYLKEKYAIPLLFIYLLYLTAGFVDVILPNMGVLQESLYVYKTIISGSLIEVSTFMFIMLKQTFNVYHEHSVLMSKQKKHQQDIINTIVNSQEEERSRVGRELHDSVGANMAVIKQKVTKSSDVYEVVSKTIDTVRKLSHGLVTPMVNDDEFIDEIEQMADTISSGKMEIHTYFHKWPEIKNKEKITHLYRIGQELLQNAVKHSKAENVYLQFIGQKDNSINIYYEDDGIGFNYDNVSKGLGLNNIQNRVNILNGKLYIDSKLNKGTFIDIDI